MKIIIFYTVLSLLLPGYSISAYQTDTMASDSTQSSLSKRSNLKLISRIHSVGLFNLSGRICNEHPAIDFTVYYDRKIFGLMAFHAIDIYDQRSDNNFMLFTIYKKIHLGNNITITPNIGFSAGLFGKYNGDRHIIISTLKLSEKLSVDNTMLFVNLIEKNNLDWINRFRARYTVDDHVDVIISLWHNNQVFDNTGYVSSAINTGYNKIIISNKITLNTNLTFLVMASSSDEESFPKKNGILFTIGAMID